ncbi:MAG: NAD(P)/FAD-dependent oxidoreductase [Candidatus Marinimicrobia bacterium]|nr:NAD(P)/FAD-dependent oxidoreductase [Candidatus Neomarinimicrobiota bacterium]
MKTDRTYDAAIIGGGIGGCAAALRAVQNNMTVLLFTGSKESRKRSRSQWVYNIDNMIGFHEGVIKDQVLNDLRRGGHDAAADLVAGEHYHINNRDIIANTLHRMRADYGHLIDIEEEDCQSLQRREDGSFIVTGKERSFTTVAVVLATGIMDEQPVVPMEDRGGEISMSSRPIYPFANRESLIYCIRCEGHLTRDDAVAVIGGSPTAAELTLMLFERYGNQVYLLTHGAEPPGTDDYRKLTKAYGIRIITEPITEFSGRQVGDLCCVRFAEHEEIFVKFGLVALGIHRVYNDLARQVGAQLHAEEVPPERRQIVINHKGESSVPGLFVVGDAGRRRDEITMKQIYTAQEYAVRAVDTIDYRRRKARRRLLLADR